MVSVAHIDGDPALWHDGERGLQAETGMREALEQRGRVVLRDHMPDQHRAFFVERRQLFLATLDAAGQPWATVVEGNSGFIASSTPKMLSVAQMPPTDDPARDGLYDGAPIGALALEFATRRRNRINGNIRYAPGTAGFFIEVVQSFGNCPKYIQARRPIASETMDGVAPSLPPQRTTALSDEDAALIGNADTFFIASRSAAPGLARSEGLDISHRGGRPGFVHTVGGRRLTFPDYQGNFFFNTLGNLSVDPRCGLLFIDFATRTTVQISGRGRVLLDPSVIATWPGAERAVTIEIDAVVRANQRLRERFEFLGYAPQFERLEAAKPFE